jgi:hypothetical protein
MGKLVLCSSDADSRARYLGSQELPDNYMGDFSMMGLVVDRYQDAVTLLLSLGYDLVQCDGGSEITIKSFAHIQHIKTDLGKKKITCDFSDIADTIYQA